jgi:hypothetical protein
MFFKREDECPAILTAELNIMLEGTFETGPALEWTPLYRSFRITPCSLRKCNKMQQLTRIPRRIKTH